MIRRWLDSMARGIASAGRMPSSLAGSLGIWTKDDSVGTRSAIELPRGDRVPVPSTVARGDATAPTARPSESRSAGRRRQTTNTAISDGRAKSVNALVRVDPHAELRMETGVVVHEIPPHETPTPA